ncbi:MAG: TIGR02099 family protein [Methylobacter sp.]|nr:MAG: TIGR02099 family protein [Methylobacter sp.]
MLYHITRATRHIIFWTLLAAAVGLSVLRLLLLEINQFKQDLTVYLADFLGAPVEIGRLQANMHGFSPELIVNNISTIASPSNPNPTIKFEEIRLSLNLPEIILSQAVLPSAKLAFVGAKFTVVRKPDNSLVIAGLKDNGAQPLWLMQAPRIALLQSQLTWQDELNGLEPVSFSNIDIALMNGSGDKHRLNLQMALPERYGERLSAVAEFSGSLFEPQKLDGKLFLNIKQAKLAYWLPDPTPKGFSINNGTGDIQLWCGWQQATLASVTGRVDIDNLQLTHSNAAELALPQLQAAFRWQQSENHWRLDIPKLQTGSKAGLTAQDLSLAGTLTESGELQEARIYSKHLHLEEITRIARFALPQAPGKPLGELRLKGELADFSGFFNPQTNAFAINGQIHQLSIASLSGQPGLEHFSARVFGNQNRGVIELATDNATLALPGQYSAPLPVDQLAGQLQWRQTQDNWVLDSKQLAIDLPAFKSMARIHAELPKAEGKAPFIDLQLAYSSDDISKLPNYLPRLAMNPRTVEWFDSAFVKGRLHDGRLLFYGTPEAFPFPAGDGVFQAMFGIQGMELKFDPGWLPVHEVNAQATFLGERLQVHIDSGFAGNNPIKTGDVDIAELNESQYLDFKGQVSGEINQVLDYMQGSPLKRSINLIRDAILPVGDTVIDLDLKIPLVLSLPTHVGGAAHFNDAKLTVKALDLPVKAITGDLKLNDHGVYAEVLNAKSLGFPIQVAVSNSETRTVVKIAGRTGIQQLQNQFDLSWWSLAEGGSHYDLSLNLPHDSTPPELTIKTDLNGIAIDLPGILGKPAAAKAPLALTFGLVDDPLMPIEVIYSDKLKAAVKLTVKQQKLFSGNILVGAGVVEQRQAPGLKFEINRENLALTDWLGIAASSFDSQHSSDGLAALIQEIQIRTPNALWNENSIGAFELDLKKSNAVWAGHIQSNAISGELSLPLDWEGGHAIELAMQKLDLSALKRFAAFNSTEPEITARTVKNFPLIAVSSEHTYWHNINLGQLTLTTERTHDGIRFKELTLSSSSHRLSATGSWLTGPLLAKTQFQGSLSSQHFGRLLQQLGITDDITETAATLYFSLAWPGAPQQFSLGTLRGEVDADLQNGRILSIEPGFGRILGILALSQWIKRLQLDFSDVYQEGLTFDTITGHFDLVNGVASNRDFLIDSIPAKISLTGTVDLAKQLVNQTVNVLPKSSDAVPIAGTIVDKLSNLIARSLTGKNQEGFFFGSQYQIKGHWDKVEIIPLHEHEGILNKTWNGITGFPWLEQDQ